MKKPSLLRRSLAALANAPGKTLKRLLGRGDAAGPKGTRPVAEGHRAPSSLSSTPGKDAPSRERHRRGAPRSGKKQGSGKAVQQSSPAHRTATSQSSMDPPPSPPARFRWIDTDEDLASLTTDLSAKLERGEFTRSFLDTEADSLHHYTEKLCLLQLAAGGEYFLIDPLKCSNLPLLFEVLDRTELWLHGADYDLTLLKRQCAWTPGRVHDTQIAARLTGHRAFGLAALVQHYCGVALCKSSQKADWSQRPLPEKMQAYAVDDVRYLGVLVERLLVELESGRRLAWFEQSCESLRQDVLGRTEKDRTDAWRISGSGNLRPKGLAMLKELWWWRDTTASEKDVPPFKVLNNQQLINLALEFQEEGRTTHPPRWRPKWRETFTAAVHRVRQSDPETWPQRLRRHQRRSTDEERARIEQLCALREAKAGKLGIEPSLLGSRDTLTDVVLNGGTNGFDALMPWQKEVLGLE
jgi:ribonuclease D